MENDIRPDITQKQPRLTKYNVSDCICRIVEPLTVFEHFELASDYTYGTSFVAAFFIGWTSQTGSFCISSLKLQALSDLGWPVSLLVCLGIHLGRRSTKSSKLRNVGETMPVTQRESMEFSQGLLGRKVY